VAASSSAALSSLTQVTWPESGAVDAGGRRLIVRRLTAVDDTAVYAASAVDGAAAAALAGMSRVIAGAAVVALVLAASGSWWLARVLARPVATLTESLERMAETRDLQAPLPRGGAVREIDALADSFDALRAAVMKAEGESDAAYAGVIGALAAALDARDPYTAGHSQRVATLSVFIAEALGVPAAERETLRLGALLHDVGKIGVNDAVLRKPGKLTPEEMDHIRLHPVLGARILQPVGFLAPHLHIVELHHERPDGRGYPHGLVGDAIPLFARIVHVADAFDAMTSARAYRSARPPADALADLRKNMGTDFDADVVAAMLIVWQQRLAPFDGVIPMERLPFRDPADFGTAARVRATLREARPVA
jgi:putative nucleotidyltransferase with HDIG domain